MVAFVNVPTVSPAPILTAAPPRPAGKTGGSPAPPGTPGAPAPPPTEPALASVVIEHDDARIPVGPPAMLPLLRISIRPPVLRIGPGTALLIVWLAPLHAALATLGAPSVASAISETPA